MGVQLELRTLGDFAFLVDGKIAPPLATQKARALLAHLVSNRGRAITRDSLVELLWPDSDPSLGRKNVNTALWSIRKSLRACDVDADDIVWSDKVSVRWTTDVLYDAETFERTEDPAQYTGDFLAGDVDEWIVAERERLAHIYEGALSARVRDSGSVESARRLLERDPFAIEAYDLVIAEEVRRGRRRAAAALVRSGRRALAELDPKLEQEFAEKYASLLTNDARPRELRLPFVGRERELETFQAMLFGEQPRVPLIIAGIAGSGKSALLDQYVRIARDNAIASTFLNANEGERRAFGPWERLYEQRVGKTLASFLETAGALPALSLGRVLSDHIEPNSLLLVDNVQFLGGDALDTLAAVIDELRESGTTIVCASRPEGLNEFRSLLGMHSAESQILAPLKAEEVHSALDVFGGVEFDRLATLLYERSEGHAFFVAQLLDFFCTEGAVAYVDGRWQFDPVHPALRVIPPGVRRFVEDRIRSLGDDAVLVAAGLALDRETDADELAQALALAPERAYDAIDDLLLHGLLVTGETWPQFAFAHDLVAETAATLVPPSRRIALHRGFAALARGTEVSNSAARVARHLNLARKPLEAAPFFEKAALEALNTGAYAQAEALAKEGIASLTQAAGGEAREGALNVLKRIMSFLMLRSGSEESITYATEAVAHAKAAGDPLLEMRAYSSRAQAYLRERDFASAITDIDMCDREAIALGKETSRALVANVRGFARHMLGDFEGAFADFETAFKIGETFDRWDYSMAGAQYAMRAAASSWQFERLDRYRTLAYAAGERAGRLGFAMSRVYDAHCRYISGDYVEAVSMARNARKILADLRGESIDITTYHVPPDQLDFEALSILTFALLAHGEWDEANQTSASLARLPYARLNAETAMTVAILGSAALLKLHAADAQEALIEMMPRLDSDVACAEPWSTLRTGRIQAAFVATRLERSDARERLRSALDAIRRESGLMPKDVLVTLAEYVSAARQLGEPDLVQAGEMELAAVKRRFDGRLTMAG